MVATDVTAEKAVAFPRDGRPKRLATNTDNQTALIGVYKKPCHPSRQYPFSIISTPLPTPYLALLVDKMPPLTSRHSTVTGKGVDHTRIGSNGSKSTEPAGKDQHHHKNNTTSTTHTIYDNLHDWESWSGGNGGIEILYTKKETNDKEPSHDTTDYNIPHAMVSNCTPIFQSPKQYVPMIAMVIPTGPLISALWVSSDICALESYPVRVNCACKSPTKTT